MDPKDKWGRRVQNSLGKVKRKYFLVCRTQRFPRLTLDEPQGPCTFLDPCKRACHKGWGPVGHYWAGTPGSGTDQSWEAGAHAH